MSITLNDLKESNEFLNLLLDNINLAVLVVDENLKIVQFNKPFLDLFDRAPQQTTFGTFGEISGCINAVKENKRCGQSSQCHHCMLRRSLIKTLVKNVPADKMMLDRVFYIDNKPVQKYLEVTSRAITYRGQTMGLIIIYDVTEIEQQKKDLQAKQDQIDHDLAAAAAIQQNLLPDRPPVLPNVRMDWKFEPSGQIGGDIFNIHYADKNAVGIYMLDVCGHGVSAALVAVTVSQFLHGRHVLGLGAKSDLLPPATVLNRLNKAFPFERFDTYFSIICLTIDYVQGILTYSNAGHPPPIIIHQNPETGNGLNPQLDILEHHGPVIGLDSNTVFDQTQIQLNPGDKAIVYTDGIFEVYNRDKMLFGQERFHEALRANHQKPLKPFIENVYQSVKTFCNGVKPHDDLSLLVAEYSGSNS